MELYLMQHGAALTKDVDPDRPLSPVGREQIIKSAQAMRKLGIRLDAVVCSPKTRAAQTADIVCELTGFPEDRIIVSDKVKAMAEPVQSASLIREHPEESVVFVAGHLPNLERLAGYLLSPQDPPSIRFENGGLTRIDFPQDEENGPRLRWHLSPLHLQIIAGA
jgi:phosphohistidine phosphatase